MWWVTAYKLSALRPFELWSQMWYRLCDVYQSWKPLEYYYRSVCSVQLWWEINLQILQLECFLSDSFEQMLFDCFYKAVFFLEENCFTVIIIVVNKIIIIIIMEKNPAEKIPQSTKTLNQITQFPTPLESKLFMFCTVVFNQN